MSKEKKNKYEFSPKKKNRIKIIRSIVELSILVFLAVVLVKELTTFVEYKPYDESEVTYATEEKDTGFISLSYFGVDRTQARTLISEKRLEKHLKALYDSGYVTITQQDVYDYYNNKKKLPEKSLFLMFEDGRRDTAIFAQKVLEKYNFKATIMTYANKFSDNDPKFLDFDDLKELKTSSFWEWGTNGYRLSYINVFDRWDNFLDCMDPKEFQIVQPYLNRKYDHYLMDFIRDKDNVPKETLKELQKRIGADYESISKVYQEGIEEVPDLYVLMHSNTGRFGSSEKASAINGEWIHKMFTMNFNREGDCLNTRQNSIYDLTRTQPQANWYTNHVLMRIWDDTKQDVAFISGDTQRKASWDTMKGETEFDEDTIILTSLPEETGLAKLKTDIKTNDYSLHVSMNGNVCGGQAVRLRGNDDLTQYISVCIQNNFLYVKEKAKKDEKEHILFELDLDDHDGIEPISEEEDEQASEIAALKAKVKYAESLEEGKSASERIQEKEANPAKSVSDGAVEYVSPVDTLEVGNRHVDITLFGNQLSIHIDEKPAVENLEVSVLEKGSIYMEAIVSKDGFSQRNLADDVYDAVFDKLYIESLPDEKAETAILYDNRLHGWAKVKDVCSHTWEALVNWFIRNL